MVPKLKLWTAYFRLPQSGSTMILLLIITICMQQNESLKWQHSNYETLKVKKIFVFISNFIMIRKWKIYQQKQMPDMMTCFLKSFAANVNH